MALKPICLNALYFENALQLMTAREPKKLVPLVIAQLKNSTEQSKKSLTVLMANLC